MATLDSVLSKLDGTLSVADQKVSVNDPAKLRDSAIDTLIYTAVFGADDEKAIARWLIWEAALELGIYVSSIHELYTARGAGKVRTDFTVPAMNMRALSYHKAATALRAAHDIQAGALIFEIARSEMGYTDQRPAEYVSSILAAAIKSGHQGPIFIQGDHFQVSAGRYVDNPDAEVAKVKELSEEAIKAGFYNVDIDTSTLVDLSQPTLLEQQQLNAELCADITAFIRGIEPDGITTSLGGEIGEVGEKNSTPEELVAFMERYEQELAELGDYVGISKISVQTGTSHGGVVLPDGSIADVAVDFETLETLSDMAREKYGLGGAVQHGASTLPEDAFNKFPETRTIEIHLATGFQNIMYDHPRFPNALRDRMYGWISENYKQGSQTEEQFYYKERKRAIGEFKQQLWDMDQATIDAIMDSLYEKFSLLFDKLSIKDTAGIVAETITPVKHHKTLADFGIVEVEQEDVSDLSD